MVPQAAAVYFGRGKEPDQYLSTSTEAVTTSNNTSDDQYVREFGLTGLDGAAFVSGLALIPKLPTPMIRANQFLALRCVWKPDQTVRVRYLPMAGESC